MGIYVPKRRGAWCHGCVFVCARVWGSNFAADDYLLRNYKYKGSLQVLLRGMRLFGTGIHAPRFWKLPAACDSRGILFRPAFFAHSKRQVNALCFVFEGRRAAQPQPALYGCGRFGFRDSCGDKGVPLNMIKKSWEIITLALAHFHNPFQIHFAFVVTREGKDKSLTARAV